MVAVLHFSLIDAEVVSSPLHNTLAMGKLEQHVRKASHWLQATIEITCHDHSIIARLCHIYIGVVLHAHPVCGESHIQCNANREIATIPWPSPAALPFYTFSLHFGEKLTFVWSPISRS